MPIAFRWLETEYWEGWCGEVLIELLLKTIKADNTVLFSRFYNAKIFHGIALILKHEFAYNITIIGT